jgi:hypothetical protein
MLASVIAKTRNLVLGMILIIEVLRSINPVNPTAENRVRIRYFEKKAKSNDPVIKYSHAPTSNIGADTLEDKYKFSPVFILKSVLLVNVSIKPV